MKVLIIENGYKDLVKTRLPLGNFIEKKGHNVIYACPNPEKKTSIINLNISRNNLSIFLIIASAFKLIKTESKDKIDVIISFRLTSNILNYLSSFFRKKRRVAVITGLGYSFTYNSFKNNLLKRFITLFYRLAEKKLTIVAQNPHDLIDLGVKGGLVIAGSGIIEPNANFINNKNYNKYNLLFVGRLLKSKGIIKAINVFKKLRSINKNFKLIIAGDIDFENPDSITKENLEEIKSIEGVEFLSYVKDINKVYYKSNILLFPSIYREGIPRVIIESLSHGLTIVTQDMPGCRETVTNNGVILKNQFVDNAVDFINNLSEEDIVSNSIESKQLFKSKFSSKKIFPEYYKVIFKD